MSERLTQRRRGRAGGCATGLRDGSRSGSGPNTGTTDRRAVLSGALCASAALAAASAGWGPVRAAPATDAPPLLTALCDITVPATDTPGALAAGVPAFVEMAIKHGMKGAGPGTMAELGAVLDAAAGSAFLNLSRPDQTAVLAKVDQATLGAKPVSPWAIIKPLILRGYYTSEIGASLELRYELTPGRYDPDLPLGPTDRAWSSDANARLISPS
jgi:hypothetical protein